MDSKTLSVMSKDHQILIAWSICKDQSLILRPVKRAKSHTNFLICKSHLAQIINSAARQARMSGASKIRLAQIEQSVWAAADSDA